MNETTELLFQERRSLLVSLHAQSVITVPTVFLDVVENHWLAHGAAGGDQSTSS